MELRSPPYPFSPFYLKGEEVQLRQNGDLLIYVSQNNWDEGKQIIFFLFPQLCSLTLYRMGGGDKIATVNSKFLLLQFSNLREEKLFPI